VCTRIHALCATSEYDMVQQRIIWYVHTHTHTHTPKHLSYTERNRLPNLPYDNYTHTHTTTHNLYHVKQFEQRIIWQVHGLCGVCVCVCVHTRVSARGRGQECVCTFYIYTCICVCAYTWMCHVAYMHKTCDDKKNLDKRTGNAVYVVCVCVFVCAYRGALEWLCGSEYMCMCVCVCVREYIQNTCVCLCVCVCVHKNVLWYTYEYDMGRQFLPG